MSLAVSHPVSFTLGSRRLFGVQRHLVPLAFSLEDALSGSLPGMPDLRATDGLRILSAPKGLAGHIIEQHPGWLIGGREDYPRAYIAMNGSFDDYLGQFSGKTRSTFKRKRRRFEEAGGESFDLRSYSTPEELRQFLTLALPLSRRTYQARLLDAGLPEDPGALAEMMALAEGDRLRAFLLFLAGEPVAYLYLPVVGHTLVYAHLGYAPEHAALSPGTVLQLAVLEQLFAENRFHYFDFTEGGGAHKALFGTNSIACSSFLLLRPTLANRALLGALTSFNAGVSAAKAVARKTGAEALVRRALRT